MPNTTELRSKPENITPEILISHCNTHFSAFPEPQEQFEKG